MAFGLARDAPAPGPPAPTSRQVRISKRLALILRHRPESAGIELDSRGWADVETLLAALLEVGLQVTRSELSDVVESSGKVRFALDESGRRIRAIQGHSVPVDLACLRFSHRRCSFTAPSSGSCRASCEKAS